MVSERKYRVYLLENAEGRRYIGLSENPVLRLAQHNTGRSAWTAKYRPWNLVWQSRSMTLGDARRLENLLKRQKGGRGLSAWLASYRDSPENSSGS